MESFESKIVGLKSSDRSELRLQKMQLQMGSTIVDFDGINHEFEIYEAKFSAINPHPSEFTLRATTISESQNMMSAARRGFPWGASVNLSLQRGTSVTYPSGLYGLDRKGVRAGGADRSHLFWSYSIQQKMDLHAEESPLSRHIPYKDHHGEFSYPANAPPTSQRIRVVAY